MGNTSSKRAWEGRDKVIRQIGKDRTLSRTNIGERANPLERWAFARRGSKEKGKASVDDRTGYQRGGSGSIPRPGEKNKKGGRKGKGRGIALTIFISLHAAGMS